MSGDITNMRNTIHQEAAWYRALTLSERAGSLTRTSPPDPQIAIDMERAQKRIAAWRSQEPFSTDPVFEDRVAMDDIGEERLLRLLGEPAEAVRSRVSVPAWLCQIADLLHSVPVFHGKEGPRPDSVPSTLLALLNP